MSQDGVIFIAAAGNDGPSAAPLFPAAYPTVIAVTAVNNELHNYPYANRGDQIDVAAPGVNIWSAVPDAREGYHTGTSFAVPYVTASVATIYRDTTHIDKKEMLDQLAVIDLGPSGRDPIYGRGLMMAPAGCGADNTTVAQDGSEPPPSGMGMQSPIGSSSSRVTPSSGPAAAFQ
jgi:subtilisin family serine protease